MVFSWGSACSCFWLYFVVVSECRAQVLAVGCLAWYVKSRGPVEDVGGSATRTSSTSCVGRALPGGGGVTGLDTVERSSRRVLVRCFNSGSTVQVELELMKMVFPCEALDVNF